MRRFLNMSSPLGLFLALALASFAAQSATVVLRSGERLAGELVDMGAGGFSVRVSGAMRRIPTGDVAVVDFGGGGTFPSNEVSRIQGQHLVVLSNGQLVTGRLTDIGGSQPLRISVDTAGGRREFSSNEVRRIYLASPPGSANLPPPPGNITPPLPITGGQIRVPPTSAGSTRG